MRKRIITRIIGDTKDVSRNPKHRIERIYADLRAGLVAAGAVLAFETLTVGVSVGVILVAYLCTPWEA